MTISTDEENQEEFAEAGDDENDGLIECEDSDFSFPLGHEAEHSILPEMKLMMEAILPRFTFTVLSFSRFEIKIPSLVLPTSLAVVNQFDLDPILLEIVVDLTENSFHREVRLITLRHPVFGTNFAGRPLLQSKFDDFFSGAYQPKPEYRSALHVLEPLGDPSILQVLELMEAGFSEDIAARALVLTRGDSCAAREYLLTGTTTAVPPKPDFSFLECPVLYLILELVDGFLDLTDHCCVGGEPLGISGLKPSNCGKPLCIFGMANVGIGPSLVSELRRDPVAADFLVCIASAAHGTKFFVPPLPTSLESSASAFFTELPQISVLARCETDKELHDTIGRDHFELLRYILFTNRCHLIHLPAQLAIKECAAQTEQFLCVVATPERELTFQKKKKKSGNSWLWHGSRLDRWHSILHTGLQDLGATADRTHAGASTDGPGVDQSNQSAVSISYAGIHGHKYGRSNLPAQMIVLALCENIKGPMLKHVANGEYTQRDLDGLIVRCIMVAKTNFSWDPQVQPPAHVPSLHECLSYIAERTG
jgi:poly [ADP-ribose] polymerase 6/8